MINQLKKIINLPKKFILVICSVNSVESIDEDILLLLSKEALIVDRPEKIGYDINECSTVALILNSSFSSSWLHNANLYRDSLRQIKCPLIIFTDNITELANNAPDIWAWRSVVLHSTV